MKLAKFWAWITFLAGVLFFFLPLIGTFEFSLRARRGVYSFDAYRKVLDDPQFRDKTVERVKLSLKPLLLKADIIGGLILGAGIAISGACPGTSLAQLGAGYRDALFIIAGGIAGALVYGYNDAAITAFFTEKGDKLGTVIVDCAR